MTSMCILFYFIFIFLKVIFRDPQLCTLDPRPKPNFISVLTWVVATITFWNHLTFNGWLRWALKDDVYIMGLSWDVTSSTWRPRWLPSWKFPKKSWNFLKKAWECDLLRPYVTKFNNLLLLEEFSIIFSQNDKIAIWLKQWLDLILSMMSYLVSLATFFPNFTNIWLRNE